MFSKRKIRPFMKNLYDDMTSCGLLKEKPTRTWLRQATFSFRKYWSSSGYCFSEEKQKPMPNGYQETIEKGRCMSGGHAFSADRNGVEK